MVSIRERFARAAKDRKRDINDSRRGLEKAAALGDAAAAEELRLLNHFQARARRDYATAPKRKAA